MPLLIHGAVNAVWTGREGKRTRSEPRTVFAASTLRMVIVPDIADSSLSGVGVYDAPAASLVTLQVWPAIRDTSCQIMTCTEGYGQSPGWTGSWASTIALAGPPGGAAPNPAAASA